jgi:NADPH:quinone reductase-like Zn-dependent oxidoreductase
MAAHEQSSSAPPSRTDDAPDGHMRAIVQHRYGSSEALALGTIDRPAVAADEVLIEVHAAGLDRGVWHVMTGTPYLVRITPYGGLRGPKTPVPGSDVAGRVGPWART